MEGNADKSKYIVMSRNHDAARSHTINADNNSFEWMEQFEKLEQN